MLENSQRSVVVVVVFFFGGGGRLVTNESFSCKRSVSLGLVDQCCMFVLRFLISSQTMKHFPPIGSKSQIDLPRTQPQNKLFQQEIRHLHVQTYIASLICKKDHHLTENKKIKHFSKGRKKTTSRKGASTIEKNLYLPDPRTNYWRIFFSPLQQLYPSPKNFCRVFFHSTQFFSLKYYAANLTGGFAF